MAAGSNGNNANSASVEAGVEVEAELGNNSTVRDPLQQSNIFNDFFASKATVENSQDPVPNLEQKDGISLLHNINTSPIEVARFIRNIKQSYNSHCGISGKFISMISTPISFSMSRLFNNLFEIGHFQIYGN